MREDMFKVIVERPRWGSRMRTSEGRRYRASEDVASKIGIKQGYVTRKYLNENLSPLKRWLESQANRPWDKVYAELCANIDRRNTVQEHIFAHIDSFVERETRLVDGKVFVLSRWGRELQLVHESSAELKRYALTNHNNDHNKNAGISRRFCWCNRTVLARQKKSWGSLRSPPTYAQCL